jgi:filamentous hemagglutinin
MSKTVERHLDDITKTGDKARPYTDSLLTVQEIMRGGKPVLDPRGVSTALRWDVPGKFRGLNGVWELVIDARTNTILHFNFVRAK